VERESVQMAGHAVDVVTSRRGGGRLLDAVRGAVAVYAEHTNASDKRAHILSLLVTAISACSPAFAMLELLPAAQLCDHCWMTRN
jgi:hypothetical protein